MSEQVIDRDFVVCIIDDDEVYQFAVNHTIKLSKLARCILSFKDGQEAIEHLQSLIDTPEHLPDVIFLDVNMPIMDGWQFMTEFQRLKERATKEMVVYMVTSSIDPVDLDRARSIKDIADYIVKPVKPDHVRKIFQDLVETKEERAKQSQ